MSFKAGLFRRQKVGLGTVWTDFSGFGLRLMRSASGKGAGRQFQCLTPAVCLSTDVIGNASVLATIGAQYLFTDFCPTTIWVSDGTNLHPLGGVAVPNQQPATLANPLVTLTLAAATGTFTAPAYTIPANLLIAGRSMIHLEGDVRHTTATATANLNLRFGNAGTSADSTAVSMNEAATTNQDTRFDCLIGIAANGVDYNTTNTASNQGHTTNGQNDRVASIVLTSALKVTMDISAGTIGDVWKVSMFRMEIWQ